MVEEEQQILTGDNESLPLATVDPLKFLTFISKLTVAFPSATAMILNYKPNNRGFGGNSKGFVNWLINDLMTPCLLIARNKEEGPEKKVVKEFLIKEDFSAFESDIFGIINNLTGYNHLMTFSEQVIKHELRTKMTLESL